MKRIMLSIVIIGVCFWVNLSFRSLAIDQYYSIDRVGLKNDKVLKNSDYKILPFTFEYYIVTGDVDNVQKCISKGIDVNTHGKWTYAITPLMLALQYTEDNQYEIVKLLVDNGADSTLKDLHGTASTDYFCSSDENDTDKILQYLFDNGADGWEILRRIFMLKEDYSETEKKDIELIQYILEHDTELDINKQDENGMTLLHWYCMKYDSSLICNKGLKIFLQYGANSNLKDNNGNTVKEYLEVKGQQIPSKQLDESQEAVGLKDSKDYKYYEQAMKLIMDFYSK